jgi:putative transcriptional regulator
MGIVVKLDDVLHARRMTLTELADRVGLTLANLSILKTGKARAIRFSTLEAICEALHCQPGDLLEYSAAPVAEESSASVPARPPVKRQLKTVQEEA